MDDPTYTMKQVTFYENTELVFVMRSRTKIPSGVSHSCRLLVQPTASVWPSREMHNMSSAGKADNCKASYIITTLGYTYRNSSESQLTGTQKTGLFLKIYGGTLDEKKLGRGDCRRVRTVVRFVGCQTRSNVLL